MPVVANVVHDRVPAAADNQNALFAVLVLTRTSARRDLRRHRGSAPCSEARLRRDHQCRFVVLDGVDPFQFLFINLFAALRDLVL